MVFKAGKIPCNFIYQCKFEQIFFFHGKGKIVFQ